VVRISEATCENGSPGHRCACPGRWLLEDEMCDFGINGLSSGASPDRLDAMVWAIPAMLSDRYWDGPEPQPGLPGSYGVSAK
jgi:phage terminase large subunit-like protein